MYATFEKREQHDIPSQIFVGFFVCLKTKSVVPVAALSQA